MIETDSNPATDSADHGSCAVAVCSPAALKARASIGADLYREGRITRAECFRLAVDASIGQDSGPIEYEANDDHQFMMTGEGLDHDEYRRCEEIYQANKEL